MNFLVIEGYKDCAEKFIKEAEVDPQVDLESITQRMQIRNSVYMF